jgi:UPF0755 protein
MRSWLALGAVFAGLGAALGYGAVSLYRMPGPSQGNTIVIVPHGGLADVAEALKAAGVVRSEVMLRGFAAVTAWQGPLRAAELAFPPHASLAAVLATLRSGRPVEHRLTIPEGLTSARISLLLAHADGLSGDVEVPREGAVLPQTYAYVRGARRDSVLQRAEAAMDHALAQAWATRAADLRLTSRHDLLVVASLVEKETRLPAERPIVARAFYNRLKRGMRLQSDPTVVYAASGGDGELPSGLTRSELDQPTPYNTYVIAGLPGGAICNPGIASIDAAAHPAQSDALYFVADGSGGHVFSDSLDEHDKNVQRYRRLSR